MRENYPLSLHFDSFKSGVENNVSESYESCESTPNRHCEALQTPKQSKM